MSYSRLWKGLVLAAIAGTPLLTGSLAKAAPHEITEFEARKLTFSALTATPVIHHYRHHAVKKSYVLASRKTHSTTVRNVSYRGRVVTRHKRNRHHRHG